MSADVKSDYVRTIHRPLGAVTAAELAAECARLEAQARRWLTDVDPPIRAHHVAFAADLRYVGQAFQVEVPLDPAWLRGATLDPFREAFHTTHERLYAHADRAAEVELIDLRATITGDTPKPPLARPPRGSGAPTPVGRRSIHYERARHEAQVYRRRDLRAGDRLAGPAIVEQDDTTTVIPIGFTGTVDDAGNLVIGGR
jgi:N-methylhydantoinase A